MWANLFGEDRKSRDAGNDRNATRQANEHRSGGSGMMLDDDPSSVLQEIVRLVAAFKEGRLTERGKATQFNGAYREMIEGVNQILDSAIPQTFCPCRSGIRDSLSLAPALRAESSLSR